jgi:hypothetical protein
MSGSVTPVVGASDRKLLRAKFGVREAAIPAVRAFRKNMPFDHGTIKTESWILIRPDGRRTHANTYDGKLGKGADYETNSSIKVKPLRAIIFFVFNTCFVEVSVITCCIITSN